MIDIPYIAEVAALIGDPTRANMLSALKDDGVLSATELAQVAGVAANTASGHLSKLVDARMIKVERKGRHRFFTLASAEVADALESLEVLAENAAPRHRPSSPQDSRIRYARSCYDHLAGSLGVQLAKAFVRLEYIDETTHGFNLTCKGADAVAELGIDLDALKAQRRCMLRACPDWSETHVHLGGALGAKLFELFCEHGWLRRRRGDRVVETTPKGRTALRQQFGMTC
jgi:DNA-binding transcriptional ArsR family regulator